MKEEFKEAEKNEFYQLLMPKNEYHKYYRQTLVPSHLKIIEYNLAHGNKNLFFFEISSVAGLSYYEELLILSGVGKLINQPLHQLNYAIDFYWIKGILENIFQIWQIESEISFSSSSRGYLHSFQSAEILLRKERIGFLGQLDLKITQNYRVNEPAFVAQISLNKIFDYLAKFSSKISYHPVSNFPTSERDLSFIFSGSIDYSEVTKEMKNIGGENLREVNIFDTYQNAEMAKKGQKSVSFRLIFQSLFRTLKNTEVEKIINVISKKVEKRFTAKLRD